MKSLLSSVTLSLFLITNVVSAQESSPEIAIPDIRRHVQFLASDSLRGRKTGERGNEIAAGYIAAEMKRVGLEPLGDNTTYFQHFSFLASINPGRDNSLYVSVGSREMEFALDKEMRPLSFSVDTLVTGPLVFAGYGITDTSAQYDDYAGIDVRGKIVIVLRYSPDSSSTGRFAKSASVRMKAKVAREHGAAGLIIVTGPRDETASKLPPVTIDRGMGDAGIAAMALTSGAVDSIFHLLGKNLRDVQEHIIVSGKPQSFELAGTRATMRTSVEKVRGMSANVLGLLRGNDPILGQEVVILGAHMDHLGMGGEGSLNPDTSAIHHGADDNASGTAGLLEAAEYFASHKDQLKRSILFIAFSGEEQGLLGSDYYVKHPAIPLEKTVAMLNMDMIGRMKDSALVVEGIGTSSGFESLLTSSATNTPIRLRLKPDGFGPSDHTSFYVQKIPVLFFFTNLHDDYHRPSDVWTKINFEGEAAIVRLVTEVVRKIANAETRPDYTQVASSPQSERREVRVSLGVIPDYAEDVVGLQISGTRPGSAAEQAGLLAKDIIVRFGGREIRNIYDFTNLLGEYKPGDSVEIVVRRGEEERTLTAVLKGRQ